MYTRTILYTHTQNILRIYRVYYCKNRYDYATEETHTLFDFCEKPIAVYSIIIINTTRLYVRFETLKKQIHNIMYAGDVLKNIIY